MDDEQRLSAPPAWPELVRKIRGRTPARIFVERGAAYPTQTELELRRAHAGAVEAVSSEFDLQRDFPPEFVAQWGLFQVSSKAASKSQFLLRPRRNLMVQKCPKCADVQIVIGDGLSGAAVTAQVPTLFPLLHEKIRTCGWSMANPLPCSIAGSAS